MKQALRRKPSGKVNPVSVLVILALIAAGYMAYFYVPLYYDNLEVREALETAMNQARLENEDRARVWLMRRLNGVTPALGTLGSHLEEDEDGLEVEKPGLAVAEDDVTFVYSPSGETLTIRVEYDRVIHFKPSEKRKTVHFVVEKEGKSK